MRLFRHSRSLITGLVLGLPVFNPAQAATPQLSMGGTHTLALRGDGTWLAWGNDYADQMGDGLAFVSPNYRWFYSPAKTKNDYRTMVAGPGYSMVIKNDGSLWVLGTTQQGASGTGSMDLLSRTPALVGNNFRTVALSRFYALGIKNDGTLWAWGENPYGQLGDGTTQRRLIPVLIGSGFSSIATETHHTLALKPDGTLWSWGQVNLVGNGVSYNSNVPQAVPLKIGSDFKAVAAGNAHSLALKNDGTLWAWGLNGSGQLGDGTTTHRWSPVKIGDGYAAIAASYDSSMAVKVDGTLWTWGYGGWGLVGEPTATDRKTPYQVGSGYSTTISLSPSNALAMKMDGSLWGWGYGQYVGNGNPGPRLVTAPVLVDASFGAGSGTSGSDCLFDWAEKTYPQFFAPAGAASTTATPYYFRYYSGTAAYLATSSADNHVWVLGASFGTKPLNVGPMAGILSSAGCSP